MIKVGIRPCIDGRVNGVHENLKEQTMGMALAASKLIRENLKYPDGSPFEVVIADTTIGGVREAVQCQDKFEREDVGVTLTVSPCWCYSTEVMDQDPATVKAVWGFNGTERPGAVFLAAVLAAHSQKGLPALANNTEMIAVRRDFADQNDITTMYDLSAYINSGKEFKLICSASFAENAMGLLGYEEAYDFKLSNDQLITLSSGNTAEMLLALVEGTSGVNASLVYGTDGYLDKMDLVVVEDPEYVPPVYLPAPVIRGEVLAQYPEIEDILAPVFETLTLETLQKLNARVAYDGEDAAVVANDYLTDNGFLG